MDELSRLYKIASMGDKPPEALATVLGNSLFGCFAYASHGALVGAGRALADGLDCAYIADVAVHPDHQGRGLGTATMRRLLAQTSQYKKVFRYAKAGTEAFYRTLGFLPMITAMAIWDDPPAAIASGVLALEPAERAGRGGLAWKSGA